ncbi:MAG: hypothetical protein IJS52_03525 [Bacilli bacterium]|nr:hypothetical protein [Bacilli bacterium]
MKTTLLIAMAFFACAIQTNSQPCTNQFAGKVSSPKLVSPKKANNGEQNGPFIRVNALDDRVVITDPIGYFIYDMSVYRADFTDVSYLYLCELDIDFTPGSVASQNESGYDWHYDFWAADISLAVPGNLSMAKVKDYWPRSSDITTTLTSEYSNNYTLTISGQVGIGQASIGGSVGAGYTITHGTSNASEDPQISSQLLSNEPKKAVWNVRCITQRGLTYSISCCYLLEMPKSYSYSFSFSSTMDMTCIAWKGFWWEQKKHVTGNESLSSR